MRPMTATGSHTPDEAGRSEVSTASATATDARPRRSSSARQLRPRRSLSQPLSSTESAPTAGKIADIAAARLTLKPRKSRMYAGVQVLNVSRTIVVAKLSRQTIRKARLRSSGSTRAAKVLGRDSAPEKTLRVRDRLRVALVGSRFAQEQQVGEEQQAGHARAKQEQPAPADSTLQQQPHAPACCSIAEQVAAGEDRGDGAVAGIAEPPGGHLDERRPADRLRQPVPDPGEGEHRQGRARCKQ